MSAALVIAPLTFIMLAHSAMLMIQSRPLLTAAALSVSLLMASCATMKKIVPDITMPDINLPKMPDVGKLLPNSEDKVSDEDPSMPFDARSKLAAGHTLRMRVYQGAREGSELFSGLVVIDENGVTQFGKTGSAKLAGHTLPEAARMIESVFRVGGRASSQVRAHIISIENVKLVAVEGDVRSPRYMPTWDAMKFSDMVNVAGGRTPGSQARAVYLVRAGGKKFFRWIGALDEEQTPQPGDILLLSPDL